MTDETPHACQIYLITPPRIAEASFPGLLSDLLDAVPVAAVRLELETRDEELISNAADALRGICHAHDVPLLIADHYRVVRRLGLDGVHLKGTRDVRDARSELGDKAIVGTFCGTSRHAGMTAGEIGADYVSFGPVTANGLGSGETAETGDFEWWHQMIEVPNVAEGGLTPERADNLAPLADFVALGSEIWNSDMTPLETLADYAKRVAL